MSAGIFHLLWLACTLAAQATWIKAVVNPLSDPPPSNRYEHSAVIFNDTVLVFGGYYITPGSRFDDLYFWDTQVQMWGLVPAPNAPPARSLHTAVMDLNHSMWVFGGVDDSSSHFDDLYIMDIQVSPSWTALSATGTAPSARAGHSAVMESGTRMWVFAGEGASYVIFNDLYYLDLETLEWTAVAASGAVPAARMLHSAAVEGQRMWVFGGYDGTGSSGYLNDLHYLDFQMEAWTAVTATGMVPSARRGHSAVMDFHQGMWVFGGYGGGFRNDLYYLDVQAETWTEISDGSGGSEPSGRASHGAVVDSLERLWIFGGFDNDWYYLELKTATPTTVSQTSMTSTSSTPTSTLSSSTSTSSSSSSSTTSSTSSSSTGSTTWSSVTLVSVTTTSHVPSTTVMDVRQVMDELMACGSSPMLWSSQRSTVEEPRTMEVMEELELEVEVLPCMDAQPVLLHWEYRNCTTSVCAWRPLESVFQDQNLRPQAVKLEAFSFQAETEHQLRAVARYEDSVSSTAFLVFTMQVLPRRRPMAVIEGPNVVSQSCSFRLSALESNDVTSAVPGDVAFVYAWSMVDDGNGTDVTQLLPQRNASVLEVLPGAFPVGMYTVTLHVWRRGESPANGGTAQCRLSVGTRPMPVISIDSSWMPGERVSITADLNLTATVTSSARECPIDNLAAWSWRWLLLEGGERVLADVAAHMTGAQTLAMSSSSFRTVSVRSGHSYAYALAGVPGSLLGYSFSELYSLGLSLGKSHSFIADLPPGLGRVLVAPCVAPSIATPITVRTYGWDDEDPEKLQYAFYRFPGPIVPNGTDECETLPSLEIEWEDVASPSYFKTLGGVLLRGWAPSPSLTGFLPMGRFHVLARARDSVGGQAASAMERLAVMAMPMNASTMTSLLQASVATGDAGQILTSVEAVLSSGAMSQMDLLDALEVAYHAMDRSPESLEQFSSMIGTVAAGSGPMSPNATRFASEMLSKVVNASGSDRRVAMAVFDSIGLVTEASQGVEGSQSELEDLAMSLGEAMVSHMEEESFATLTNQRMELEVSKTQRTLTSKSAEQFKKGRLELELDLPGEAAAQSVTITSKVLVWNDYRPGPLDETKGLNAYVPEAGEVIITEISQDCVDSPPVGIGTRHNLPSEPQPAMTVATCAQFNETEEIWWPSGTELHASAVDCSVVSSCGRTRRSLTTVVYAPDVWGTLADGIFVLWLCLMVLSISIILGVTLILSIYKFEIHVKHTQRMKHKEHPKAHAWSVVPLNSGQEQMVAEVEIPPPLVIKQEVLEAPYPAASLQVSARGSRDVLGPVESAPLEALHAPVTVTAKEREEREAESAEVDEDPARKMKSLESLEEMVPKKSSVKEAWG
ncbi:unnamed protein product [Durusdinium trenchii]|uniref:PKD/REJ-like domain-containing protein n=1 Tax=Durusdinium trenchii TaxID=1381693 RepID=A0ABP0NJ71_9DINO